MPNVAFGCVCMCVRIYIYIFLKYSASTWGCVWSWGFAILTYPHLLNGILASEGAEGSCDGEPYGARLPRLAASFYVAHHVHLAGQAAH